MAKKKKKNMSFSFLSSSFSDYSDDHVPFMYCTYIFFTTVGDHYILRCLCVPSPNFPNSSPRVGGNIDGKYPLMQSPISLHPPAITFAMDTGQQ